MKVHSSLLMFSSNLSSREVQLRAMSIRVAELRRLSGTKLDIVGPYFKSAISRLIPR